MLSGALDENLRRIENALDVAIARRAERFSISGDPGQVELASRALRKFYDLAARDLTLEDIQLGLVEIARLPEGGAPEAPALRLPRKSELSARTPRQAQYLRQMQTHDITFGVGPAGTGKTYLAVAAAVDAFERDAVKRILLTRPAVEAGEKLGFLPGDLAQKVDPYLRPLYDALYDLMGFDKVAKAVRARRDRGRAARLHARAHAQPLLHHSRRGAEHHARADEDVPDAHRFRQQGRHHRRRDADRPGARTEERACRRAHVLNGRARHRLHRSSCRGRGAPSAGAAIVDAYEALPRKK